MENRLDFVCSADIVALVSLHGHLTAASAKRYCDPDHGSAVALQARGCRVMGALQAQKARNGPTTL
jgi:hypothetical protein